MSEGESARSGTALARRFYLHVEAGGQIKPHDLSLLVQAFEKKDREIAALQTRLTAAVAAGDLLPRASVLEAIEEARLAIEQMLHLSPAEVADQAVRRALAKLGLRAGG